MNPLSRATIRDIRIVRGRADGYSVVASFATTAFAATVAKIATVDMSYGLQPVVKHDLTTGSGYNRQRPTVGSIRLAR